MSAAQSTDLPRVFVPPAPLSRAVMALAGLKFLVHMATAGNYPFHRDELYYLVCGRHPAWGYPDHPPLTPWLSAVSEHLFGLSPWGLRLWPALAVALSPLYMSSGSLMQTVALDQLFWVAGSAALVWGAGLLLGRLLPRDRRHVP